MSRDQKPAAVRRLFQLAVRQPRPEVEAREELEAHLAMKIDALRARGLDPEQARLEARRQFGEPAEYAAECGRVDRGRDRWRNLVDRWDSARLDLQVAARRIWRSPGFALANVLLIGLAIAAATILYSIARGVVLRPLPFPDARRLYSLVEESTDGRLRLADYPTFRDWQAQSTAFERLAFVRGSSARWSSAETTERVLIAYVSPDFFPLLGREALLGRTFRQEQEPIAVTTHRFWRERLGGDPGIVGRVLRIDGAPVRVAGVMPPGVGYPTWADIWMPFDAMPPVARRSAEQRGVRADGGLIGRLRPDRSAEEARTEMKVIAERLAADQPEEQGSFRSVRLMPLATFVLQSSQSTIGDPRQPLRYVAGGLGLLILIAAANLANLALARTAQRNAELALRVALGAGRWRVTRLVLIETAIVVMLGGSFGLAMGAFGTRAVRGAAADFLPRFEEISFDPIVALGALGLMIAMMLVVGLLPAWLAAGAETGGAERAASRIAGGRRQHRLRRGLVVAQVAVAAVMVIGSGLVVRSLRRVLDVPLGFDPAGLAVVLIDPDQEKYTNPAGLVTLYRGVAESFTRLPGVEQATIVNFAPLVSGGMPTRVLVDGEAASDPAADRTAIFISIAPNYFQTMGIPIRQGRVYTESDLAGVNGGLIVNEGMARRLGPATNPIGRRIVIFRSVMGRADFGEPIEGRVIGVAGDVRQFGAESPVPDAVYVPMTWNPWRHSQIVVRVAGDPKAVLPTLEREVHRQHPDLATRGGPASIQTFTDARTTSEATRRLVTWLILGFGASALALVVVGLYAVISFLVGQRSREIGVRMALGATGDGVLRSVLKDGVGLAAGGIAIGLLLGWAMAGLAKGLVYGVEPTDPISFLVAGLLLVAVAIAATIEPARRAAKTDPGLVLRGE